MKISPADFEYVRRLAYAQAALVIEPGKEYLVETRLAPIARQSGYRTLSAYIKHLQSEPRVNGVHHRAVEALTTNETFFFRDFHPFEVLRRQILPSLLAQRAAVRRLRIWSAACSTGQEPYTLAMLLREHFPELATNWNVSILATDLVPAILEQARAGKYTQFEVNRGLPASFLIKYFTQRGDSWCVNENLKTWIDFQPMNLVQPWPVMQPFDLILLRNVMIYFDVETKRNILKKVRTCLLPHGYLFLGTSETTTNLDLAYEPVSFGKAVVYRLASAVRA